MRRVLGFDGGGTKTDCTLMDETGVILAWARSGSSNPTSAEQDLREFAREVIDKLELRKSNFFLAKTGGAFDGRAFLHIQFAGLVHSLALKARIGPLPRPVAEAAVQRPRDALTNPLAPGES